MTDMGSMGIREKYGISKEDFNSLPDNIRNYITMTESSALHDPLTGLTRREYFETMSQDYIEDMIRDSETSDTHQKIDSAMAKILIDTRDFKAINDNLGNPNGDRALQAIAKHLRKSKRRGDGLCRFGGDEFAYLLKSRGRGVQPVTYRVYNAAMQLPSRVGAIPVDYGTDVPDEFQNVNLDMGASIINSNYVKRDSDKAGLLKELYAHSDIASKISKGSAKKNGKMHMCFWSPEGISESATHVKMVSLKGGESVGMDGVTEKGEKYLLCSW